MRHGAPVRIIMGPTAAGKSAVAMHLAHRFRLAIVSADSRQLYRGFDIGTAKPRRDERAAIPHYGVDVIDPVDRFSAPRWADAAAIWMDEAVTHGRTPIIVGGTGFYVRALTRPVADAPPIEVTRRAQLEPVLAALDATELARWCRRLDPARAHLGRTQHLRAVETALLAGTRLSDAHAAGAPRAPMQTARYLVVDPGPALQVRIAHRVDAMVREGWPEEVEALLTSVPPEAPAWNASGYSAMRDAVTGACTMAAAVARIVVETRQYAKRQRTWNRHQLPVDAVTILDSSAPDALAAAEAWWQGTEDEA